MLFYLSNSKEIRLSSVPAGEEVDVVDTQGRELLVGAVESHQKTAVGHVSLARFRNQTSQPSVLPRLMGRNETSPSRFLGESLHGLTILSVLELVNLAVADILVAVGQGLLNAAELGSIAPASLIVLAAVEGQGSGQGDPEVLANLDGEELLVDVELHAGLAIGGGAVKTVDAVVLGVADALDLELVLEELGVGSKGGHCEVVVDLTK